MRRTIRAVLGENARNLGTLRFDVQGARESAAFEYDAAWLAAADRFALDPGLPLVTGPQFHRKERGGSVFHGAIAVPSPTAGRAVSFCATTPSGGRKPGAPASRLRAIR